MARVDSAPALDGKLDEPIWDRATIISDFLQRVPVEGSAPTERTDVSVVYTQRALYIGLTAHDSHPDGIVATVSRRDDFELTKNDQFALAIDSYNDGRNGYWFSTNPIGARVDAQFSNEGDVFETNWDGAWQCRTTRGSAGWTAEIEIPFSTLRFDASPTNVMGINFFRRVIRTNEQLFAPLIGLRYANGTPNVSAARKYLFKGITGGRRLYLKPYALGGIQEAGTDRSELRDLGLDIRYNVTDSLTASLSYNTDFAQAEVDEQQINLTRFNLFFPEKRDFFLESAANFTFGLSQEAEMFSSRRIGLEEGSGGSRVPILVGGKVTGKIKAVEIGMLSVQTRAFQEAPSENFVVARFKVPLARRSYAGGLVTNRSAMGSHRRTYGADFNVFVFEEIGLKGFAAVTSRSDRRTDMSESSATSLSLFKGGEATSFNVGFLNLGPDFDPAVGFISRSGLRKWDAQLSLPFHLGSGQVRRITPALDSFYYDGISDKFRQSESRVRIQVDLRSDDQVTAYLKRTSETVPEPFLLFGSTSVSAGDYQGYEGGVVFQSKPGRRVSGALNMASGGFYGGSRQVIGAEVEWKVNSYLTLAESYQSNWIDFQSGSFRTHLAVSRMTLGITHHASLASLVQYDNVSDQFGLNVRFNYIFSEGTEIFLLLNHVSDGLGRAGQSGDWTNGTVALLKCTYLFRFGEE